MSVRTIILRAIFFTGLIFVVGCSQATLKTFVDPSIQPGSIRSISIFPVRNVRLIPDEYRELNRSVSQMFHQKNPNVKIVGATESITLINQAALADEYSEFLRDYARSGIPNINTLKAIGETLSVDAILQGEVFNIRRIDGVFGRDTNSVTSLTVRYVLLATHQGNVLWEGMSNATIRSRTVFQPAPPLYQAISIAQNKILTALPTLGK